MILSQYKETCELLLDDQKTEKDNNKEFEKGLLGIFCIPILICIAED